MQHGFSHRLRRNRACVDARPAHALPLLYDRHPLTALGRLNRRPLPRRAGAEHNHVEALHGESLCWKSLLEYLGSHTRPPFHRRFARDLHSLVTECIAALPTLLTAEEFAEMTLPEDMLDVSSNQRARVCHRSQ